MSRESDINRPRPSNGKTVILIAVFLAVFLSSWPWTAAGQAPEEVWSKTLGGAGDDRGLSLCEVGDNGYILVGYTCSKGAGKRDLWMVKTDADGKQDWEKTFGGPGDDLGWSVLEIDDGYVIAGTTEMPGSGNKDVWLIKTDLDGDEGWSKTFGGPDDDWGVSLIEASGGGYVVVGVTESYGSGGMDGWVIKTDIDGNKDWDKAFGATRDDQVTDVLKTRDGGYIIVGTTESYGSGGQDLWLIKIDPDGETVWDKTFGKGDDEAGCSVLETEDGYIVTGFTESRGSGSRDLWLIETDIDGGQRWDKTFGGADDDGGWSIQKTTDGYIIAGYTGSKGAGDQDAWLIKVDQNGEAVWDKTFGGPGFDLARSFQETKDGGYVLIGWTEPSGSGGQDLWLMKAETA